MKHTLYIITIIFTLLLLSSSTIAVDNYWLGNQIGRNYNATGINRLVATLGTYTTLVATTFTGGTFSGTFVGDGSALTGIPSSAITEADPIFVANRTSIWTAIDDRYTKTQIDSQQLEQNNTISALDSRELSDNSSQAALLTSQQSQITTNLNRESADNTTQANQISSLVSSNTSTNVRIDNEILARIGNDSLKVNLVGPNTLSGTNTINGLTYFYNTTYFYNYEGGVARNSSYIITDASNVTQGVWYINLATGLASFNTSGAVRVGTNYEWVGKNGTITNNGTAICIGAC